MRRSGPELRGFKMFEPITKGVPLSEALYRLVLVETRLVFVKTHWTTSNGSPAQESPSQSTLVITVSDATR